MPKKPLSKHVQVGDIISYTFNDQGANTPEPWVGTVVERKFCEWFSATTGRWREGLSLGVMWDSTGCDTAQEGVFWVTPREWEAGRYALVATSLIKRSKRKGAATN